MSQVDRVDVYTRQSMYAVLWVVEATVLYRVVAEGILPTGRVSSALLVLLVLLITVAATRVLGRVMSEHPDSWRIPFDVAWPLPALAALGALVLVSDDADVRLAGATLLAIPVSAALSGVRGRRETVAIVVLLAGYVAVVSWDWFGVPVILVVHACLVFTVRVSLWMLDVVRQLDRARDAGARLAVAEERLRFSRDVHDVMGRQLSTIAVSSELAAALAVRADPRAGDKMLEVREMAHDALREARELARGYRPPDLEAELEGARSLLRSAGIEVELSVADVPQVWHEPAGWVIREAVTNVLRHSDASRVRLRWDDHVLSVDNDGVVDPRRGDQTSDQGNSDGGAGLTGLRERLAPLGAVLGADRHDERFVLQVRFPAEVRA